MNAHCHGCNGLRPLHQMFAVDVLVAAQTHSSPAEYDEVHVCHDCFHRGDVDDDYERAERSVLWERRGGGGL